jgi:hypothetical protein
MWVWRLVKEDDYTDAHQMQHNEQFFRQSPYPMHQPYVNCNFTPARLGECRTWIINEIFGQQKLRQGWCGIGLDLRLPREQWIRNYQSYSENPQEGVELLYSILARMLNIVTGDTIFLPRVGNNQLSDDHFTVVTAAGNYCFENRYEENMYWRQDFGHVIPLNGHLTRTFPYSVQTLQAKVFRAPFIASVVRVINSEYRGFGQFLRNQNYPFKSY